MGNGRSVDRAVTGLGDSEGGCEKLRKTNENGEERIAKGDHIPRGSTNAPAAYGQASVEADWW